MENVKKKLTDKQKRFFNNLSIYIDKPIYFYGSINRIDYLPGKSDIDVDIFTDNESSTIQMLCNYLNLNKNEFKKCFYKISSNIVNGYKAKYNDINNNIEAELSIYNNKYKYIVLDDHNKGTCLPLYISVILIVVKFFYYTLGIISKDIYSKIKILLMNPGSELKFILVDT